MPIKNPKSKGKKVKSNSSKNKKNISVKYQNCSDPVKNFSKADMEASYKSLEKEIHSSLDQLAFNLKIFLVLLAKDFHFMPPKTFNMHMSSFHKVASFYANSLGMKFHPTHFNEKNYEKLRDNYKKERFEGNLIDISSIVAIYSLSFLPLNFLENDPLKKATIDKKSNEVRKLQQSAKEHVLGYGSIIILKSDFIRDSIADFNKNYSTGNQEAVADYIRNSIKKPPNLPRHPKNVIKYLTKLKETPLLDKQKLELVYPLSQVYRAYLLEMKLYYQQKIISKAKNELLKDKSSEPSVL